MNSKKISEELQRQKFAEYYYSKEKKIYFEVPVFCRSVDVVEYNIRKNTITAIEFKIKDWKRAINQAFSVSMCFDYLEICINKPKTIKGQSTVVKECSEIGIGLYFYDIDTDSYEHLCEPKKTSDIWEVQRESIFKYIGGVKEWRTY